MNVTYETDTGIKQEVLVHPVWDDDNEFFVVRTDRKDLPYVLLQLKEWVRQLELELSGKEVDAQKEIDDSAVGAFILQHWGSDFETILNSNNQMIIYVKDNSKRPPVGSYEVRPTGEIRSLD